MGKNELATIPQITDEIKFPFPKSPPVRASMKAIYSAGKGKNWEADEYGRPSFPYKGRDGHITIYYGKPPNKSGEMGDLWEAVFHNLSAETADVFLILMECIARLWDHREIARITLEEIARDRGVKNRDGSTRILYADLKAHVLAVANLSITMVWKNYPTKETLTFGKDQPDRLLDIVDWEYEADGKILTAFTFRCGQALGLFLDHDGMRWIGYCSKALLKLDPYHEGLVKGIGMYWLSTQRNKQIKVTPRTILEFCGETPDYKRPHRTVDAFIKAHNRLIEIWLLLEVSDMEPINRSKGYFEAWLQIPIKVTISPSLWEIREKGEPLILAEEPLILAPSQPKIKRNTGSYLKKSRPNKS